MHNMIHLDFNGKPLQIKLSPTAQQALRERDEPLHVEMELYFSCMIRKKVRFYEQAGDNDYRTAAKNLKLSFRPVMTQQCSIHDNDGSPPVTDFPIANPGNFIPNWLSLHFHKGVWQGEFGY